MQDQRGMHEVMRTRPTGGHSGDWLPHLDSWHYKIVKNKNQTDSVVTDIGMSVKGRAIRCKVGINSHSRKQVLPGGFIHSLNIWGHPCVSEAGKQN